MDAALSAAQAIETISLAKASATVGAVLAVVVFACLIVFVCRPAAHLMSRDDDEESVWNRASFGDERGED